MLAVIVGITLVFLDQITKYIALIRLKPIGSIHVIEGIFSFTFVENRGAAFGLMQGFRWFFVISTVVILIGLCYYYRKLPKGKVYAWVKVAIVLIVSGAIGNLIDRVLRSYVIDFLHATFIDFPVFNFADIFVVIGSILLAVLMMFFIKEESGDIKHDGI